MLALLERASSGWVLAVVAIGLIVRQVVKFMMFRTALKNSSPGERPQIIDAMRGLIGRAAPVKHEDKE